MKQIRLILPLFLTFGSLAGHAQSKFNLGDRLHGGSISFGVTGQYSTVLTASPVSGTFPVATSGGSPLSLGVSNQQQFTTDSPGLAVSFQIHPVPWAGVEVNYGYTKYSEIYQFNYSNATSPQAARFSTDAHEATAAYQFHPKHIPLQPFVNIGGGAIDFVPNGATNQWRGAGLLEVGLDLPSHYKHLGIRIEGRSLYYRAPDFSSSVLSTHGWRATEEPSASIFYKF